MMTKTISKTLITNNSKAKLPDHVHIFSVEDHDYWKPKLLSSIDQMKADNNIELNEAGYYYDFNIQKAPRTYRNLIDNILLSPIEELGDIYGLRPKAMGTPWFQQYLQGSDFGWHQHSGHWAMIYYVELPEMTEATEFLNYGQFDVKEGDILFFPTFLNHRSPTIKSNLRKTIISRNLDFEVDRELIGESGEKYFRH